MHKTNQHEFPSRITEGVGLNANLHTHPNKRIIGSESRKNPVFNRIGRKIRMEKNMVAPLVTEGEIALGVANHGDSKKSTLELPQNLLMTQ